MPWAVFFGTNFAGIMKPDIEVIREMNQPVERRLALRRGRWAGNGLRRISMGSLRFFLLAGGWILLFYQGFSWFQYGHWIKFSLLFPIERFGPSELTAWLLSPGSLPGLHGLVVSVLGAIDLSIFMILTGWVLTTRARWIEIMNQYLGYLPSGLGNAFSRKSGEEIAAPLPNVPSTGGVPDREWEQKKVRTRYWGTRR